MDLRVVDARRECWSAFDVHLRRWHLARIAAGEMSWVVYLRLVGQQMIANAGLTNYLLVAATKPPARMRGRESDGVEGA